ncbi:MAG TPA: protein kinase [Kofleriaceae bacterium]|nr:protein kinase [Kofleriaceae bacterium]
MLGELLGRGGMAEVFAGHSHGSHGFQKPVAIKRLLPELANDHVFVERLIGEAKLLISLQHGNIVSVLDLARDGEDVFLVMEYVDGPSLRQLIKARGNRGIPMPVASYVVQAAAAGLEFAHARPGGAIVHADISPSNILLTTSGEVRVADFGIARREGGGAGVVEGKWAYMAPEQARGESLTPRSDVFALGVVLYELITGQHPLGKQVSAEERDSGPIRIAPPRVINPKVPAGLDAICMKALSENARDRYARMQHMIDAIIDERFSNGWREGANDLAGLINEVKPGAGTTNAGPRTQVTDRPVTIMTRSLISESALAKRRASSPRLQSQSQSQPQSQLEYSSPASTSVPSRDFDSIEATHEVSMPTPPRSSAAAIVPPSGARTMLVEMPALPAPMLAPTPEAIAAAAAAQAYARMSSPMLNPELASVHGGHTFTGSAAIDVRDARSNKWTFAVLGIAALLGVIAAVSISTSGGARVEAKPAPAPVEQPVAQEQTAPQAAQTEEVVTPPTVEAPAAIEQPAPAQVPVTETAEHVDTKQETATPTPRDKGRKVRTPVAPKATPTKGDRVLRLESDGGTYARATLNGVSYDVPGGKIKLNAGTYTVKFENRDLGKKFTCPVTVAKDVQSLKVYMEDGTCDVY